jgi:hypothetical protein
MHEATRLPRDVRIRLRMQGMLPVRVPLTVLLPGGFLFLAWTLLTPLPPDPELDAMLAEHQAQMRALQEGR